MQVLCVSTNALIWIFFFAAYILLTQLEQRSFDIFARNSVRRSTISSLAHARQYLLDNSTIVLLSLSAATRSLDFEFVVVTAAGWSYRFVLFNWIKVVESLGIHNYIVLCYDRELWEYIGPRHGILVRNIIGFNYTTEGTLLATARNPKNWFTSLVAFNVMMLAKYDSIWHIMTNRNISVIWMDVDALPMKPCALSYLLSAPPYIDIIGQRGQSPQLVSDVVGACLCTGYFMVRPSYNGKALIAEVRSILLKRLATGGNQKEDDQSMMNEILYRWNAYFDRPVSYINSRVTVDYTNSSMHIPIAEEGSDVAEVGSRKRTKRRVYLGLLPYEQFPRGVYSYDRTARKQRAIRRIVERAIENGTLASLTDDYLYKYVSATRQEREVMKYTSTAGDIRAKTILSDSERHAAEWSALKDRACIWHRLSKKSAASKVAEIQAGGMWLLNSNSTWASGTTTSNQSNSAGSKSNSIPLPLSVREVQSVIYGEDVVSGSTDSKLQLQRTSTSTSIRTAVSVDAVQNQTSQPLSSHSRNKRSFRGRLAKIPTSLQQANEY